MAVSRENLTAWLRDAHAMENQAIEILEKQASRLEHYPELRAKVRSHLEELHRQAERVERCLHQLGTDTSGLKTAVGKMVGTAQQLAGLFASDEVLKSGIADYAFEHYEIASYKMLISTATEAGEHEVGRILEENLREEEANGGVAGAASARGHPPVPAPGSGRADRQGLTIRNRQLARRRATSSAMSSIAVKLRQW